MFTLDTVAKQLVIPLLIVVSGFICLEYAIPIAVGELAAGVLGELLFGLSSTPWLDFLAHLGLLSLMFLAGFEINLKLLRKNVLKSMFIGGFSFGIPFALVFAVCLGQHFERPAALLIGTALSTTSLAIVFPVLRRHGMMAEESGQLLLASAMIVDITSMLMLSVVFYQFSVVRTLLTISVIVILVYVKKFVLHIFQRYRGNRTEFEMKFLLFTLLSFSVLSEWAGVHDAIVCFILGVIFSDVDPEHEVMIERMSTIVFGLLAPVFFFHAGTKIQFGAITLNSVVIGLVFLGAGIIGKWLGTYLPLKALSVPHARFAGVVFNYRLSFGLIAAIYGLESGVISADISTVILLCVLVSSLIAAYLQKRLSTGADKIYETSP